MVKRFGQLAIAALTISAIYLYAWPAPNLFYVAAVLFHVGLGVAFCVVGFFLLREALRGPVLIRLGSLILAVGSILGLALIYTGTSRIHWNLMYAHIAVSAIAVILLAAWFLSPERSSGAQLVGNNRRRGGRCRHDLGRRGLCARILEPDALPLRILPWRRCP